jgi:GNAT superfamily N-acetyltransferase
LILAMSRAIRLRPVTAADRDFLLRLYAATRADELALVHWPGEQKRAFLEMQFNAQSSAYDAYPTTTRDIILVDECEAGRLYVGRWAGEICVVDISLRPEFRGQGIGTGLLQALATEAAREHKPLRVHVERFNPALRLYTRLGFRAVADKGVYLQLELASTA